jgi:phosphoribosyl-AMP cyclohydrolase
MSGAPETIESTDRFTPRYDASGLITVVVTRHGQGGVLMVAHMNATALERTLASGEAWFWSRSRQGLWRKGDTSGQVLRIRDMRVDCDQDALWIAVDVGGDGGVCHTGAGDCFYRRVVTGPDGSRLVHLPEGKA